MKPTSIEDALKAIQALPPKQRAAAIADLHTRQSLEALKLVMKLAPDDLVALAARFPAPVVKDMNAADYANAKAGAIRNARSAQLQAGDARDLAKATARHQGSKK